MVTTDLENNANTSSTPNSTTKGRTSWNINTPTLAKNTINRIRLIVESLKISPNPAKPMIPLTIGKFLESFKKPDLLRVIQWKFFNFNPLQKKKKRCQFHIVCEEGSCNYKYVY